MNNLEQLANILYSNLTDIEKFNIISPPPSTISSQILTKLVNESKDGYINICDKNKNCILRIIK